MPALDYSAYDFPSYWEVLQQRAVGENPPLSAGFGAGHGAGDKRRKEAVISAIGDHNYKVFSAAFDLCKQLDLDVDKYLIAVVNKTDSGAMGHVSNIASIGQMATTQPYSPRLKNIKESVKQTDCPETSIKNIRNYLRIKSSLELHLTHSTGLASAPCRLMGSSSRSAAAATAHSEEKTEPSFSPGPR